jgi:hypothetical protein
VMNNPLTRYDNLPEQLGEAIAQQLIQNGAAERVKSSALATLAKHRDQRRKSRRDRVLVGILLIWLSSSFGFWLVGKMPNAIAQSESNKVTAPKESATQPRLLRINLTLSDPSDLKVKQGDVLKVDQVISDREDERKRLVAQRAEYLSTIKILSLPTTKPIEPLNIKKIPSLPDQSFAETEANIDLQRIKVKAAEQKVTQQKQKLELIETLSARDLPTGTKEHESVKLSEFETALRAEEARLTVELGKFESEKSGRSLKQYELEQAEIRYALEKNRSLQEYSKAVADYDRTEQERVFRVAEMQSKVALVDEKLKEISTVRAQYASEVKRVRFIKQTNNQIDVELLLYIVNGDHPNIGTGKTTQSNGRETGKPFNQESFTDKPN